MTPFYIVIGVAVFTAIITIIAFNRGASKGSHDWDHLDPEEDDKDGAGKDAS